MKTNKLALVIDDEPSICWGFQQLLSDEGMEVIAASSAEQGLELAKEHQPALIVLDIRLPGMDGLTALHRLANIAPQSPVVIMTAFGDLQTAVQAVRCGAADYLTKPFGIDRARAVCRAVLQQRALQLESADGEGKEKQEAKLRDGNRLIGRCEAMQEIYRQIAMVAASNLSVLITGETGTGKELIAAAIHQHSQRRERPYMAIAPVAVNPTLIESELFGHVRGAFTGAAEDRAGLFALADGGTVFLDEIGDLPMAIQVKLLRVLEQQQYTPVGDVHPRTCNVRILAATNANLRRMIDEGEFREDLYFRLAAVEIHAPPLRDREEDLEMLVQHFLRLAGHVDPERGVGPQVLAALRQRPWPGNIRELRNVVEHAAVMARGGPLMPEHLPPQKAPQKQIQSESLEAQLGEVIRQWAEEATVEPSVIDLLNQFLATVEPTLLMVVMDRTGGNRAAAAEMLGIHRGTLRDRLRRYGMDH